MKSNWHKILAKDFITFNPKTTLKKGAIAKKIAMDAILPFTKKIPIFEMAEYAGGAKFCNGDTIMARITPCLENGKTAFVDILSNEEIAFGSTEFIVMRAIHGVSDPQFVYYLATSPFFREIAIKSMVGSSGRQRVQQSVLDNVELFVPNIEIQEKIGRILQNIDEKIAINNQINENLEKQSFLKFEQLFTVKKEKQYLDSIAILNPTRKIRKGEVSRYIDMSSLSTKGCFPTNWEYKTFNGGMKFTNGDTIFARITPCLENGKCAYINFLKNDEISFGSTEYIVLAPKENIPSEFLYCLSRHEDFRKYVVKNMNGSSGRQRVSADIVSKYELPVLNEKLLAEFSSVAKPIFEKVKYNSLENISLANLRDTLLPKLMSGEIDVSNIDI